MASRIGRHHHPDPKSSSSVSFCRAAVKRRRFFILPPNNTFSPNSVGPRAMRPGAAMLEVENQQCLPGRGRTGATIPRVGENHPETNFSKNKILAPPEFLFFRRITIFQDRMLFSRRKIPRILPSATLGNRPIGGTTVALSAFRESHFRVFDLAVSQQCGRRSLTCGLSYLPRRNAAKADDMRFEVGGTTRPPANPPSILKG